RDEDSVDRDHDGSPCLPFVDCSDLLTDHNSKAWASRRGALNCSVFNGNRAPRAPLALSGKRYDLCKPPDGLSEVGAPTYAANCACLISARWHLRMVAVGVRSCAKARADG